MVLLSQEFRLQCSELLRVLHLERFILLVGGAATAGGEPADSATISSHRRPCLDVCAWSVIPLVLRSPAHKVFRLLLRLLFGYLCQDCRFCFALAQDAYELATHCSIT